MNVLSKSADAFRTISEVAQELDLPQHVLRFWETRFSQIKPMKRGGGRRYYRPDDVELLRGIKHLLYGEGYTIKGVQRILKEQGVRHVIMSVHGGETEVDNPDPAIPAHMDAALHSAEPSRLEVSRPPLVMPPHTSQDAEYSGQIVHNGAVTPPAQPAQAHIVDPSRHREQIAADPAHPYEAERLAALTNQGQPASPNVVVQSQVEMQIPPRDAALAAQEEPARVVSHIAEAPLETPVVNDAMSAPAQEMQQPAMPQQSLVRSLDQAMPAMHQERAIATGEGHIAPDSSVSAGILSRLKGEKNIHEPKEIAPPSHIDKDDVRRLQSTLFELLECKRILDRARS